MLKLGGFLAVALMLGCGGAKTKDGPPAGRAWKDMDHDQRTAFMKDTVLPEMKAMFVAFSADYAEMDCKTCHGAGAEDGSFEMPNADIWVLPSEAGWKRFVPDAEETKWLEFMGGKVKPAMAKLLGTSDYNWETGQGDFNCSGCHATSTDDATLVPTSAPTLDTP